MEKTKIDRINELGRLMKERALTEEEKAEQAALRAEYMEEVRAALRKK
jgi:5-formyltetrahydrofolate cyclo-ligase